MGEEKERGREARGGREEEALRAKAPSYRAGSHANRRAGDNWRGRGDQLLIGLRLESDWTWRR